MAFLRWPCAVVRDTTLDQMTASFTISLRVRLTWCCPVAFLYFIYRRKCRKARVFDPYSWCVRCGEHQCTSYVRLFGFLLFKQKHTQLTFPLLRLPIRRLGYCRSPCYAFPASPSRPKRLCLSSGCPCSTLPCSRTHMMCQARILGIQFEHLPTNVCK